MTLPMNYTADVGVFLGQITEVDMASAGLTVIRAEGLLPAAVLARVEALPKSQQSVAIGKLSRLPAFQGLANAVTRGIQQRVAALLQENDIGPDRVLSVKRDAVFVTGPSPSRLTLPDGTVFKIKGSYTSFAKLGTVELYGVPRRAFADLKGIPPEKRALHREYTVRFVLDVLGLLERGSAGEAAHTVQAFRRDYCARKLPAGFYREFNAASCFAVAGGSRIFQLEGAEAEASVEALEIAHNLQTVIIPLARGIA